MLAATRTAFDTKEVGNWGLDVAKDVGELLHAGSVPFSRTISRLLGLKWKGPRHKLLSDREQEFLHEISLKRKNAPCLFIADNFHYWDDRSTNFLAQVVKGLWDNEYPDLPNTRILLVWADGDEHPSFVNRVRCLFGSNFPVLALDYVSKDVFRAVFRALGAAESVPAGTVDSIYAVCQGDLLFSKQLAELIRTGSADLPSQKGDDQLTNALAAVLDARLRRFGETSAVLRDFISCLCAVAQALRPSELACLFPDQQERGKCVRDLAS